MLLNHTYRLFGQLFINGPTKDLLFHLKSISDFSDELPGEPNSLIDELAANHYHIFGLNVYPYQSIFLDPENNLGGQITNEVQNNHHTIGFFQEDYSESPDHIGIQLLALAHLCALETEAITNQDSKLQAKAQIHQHRLLKNHLLSWVPALTQAILQQDERFYAVLAEYTLELLLSHYHSLPADLLSISFLPDITIPDILDDHKTGLRQIARFLLTPIYSGLYLSRDKISALGKKRNLPHGFGERQQILTNLFQTAVEYEELPQLVSDILKIIRQWRNYFQIACKDYPQTIPEFVNPWLKKLENTEQLLKKLKNAATLDL